MLEIPESHHISKQLNELIRGKKITSVQVCGSPHRFAFYHGDPLQYIPLLTDRMIQTVQAFGGLIEIDLDGVKVVLGDGINIRYIVEGTPLPKKHQLLLELEGNSYLVCTVQMYGGMWAFHDGEFDNFYYEVAKSKPSPLEIAFDRDYFEQLFQDVKPSMSAKGFLATEQRIPGLGNGVLQDILIRSKIHPKRKIESLSTEEKNLLFECVKDTIMEMTESGGRDTEKDIFGKFGGYETILSKNTWKEPCKCCGDDLVKQSFLGGSIYFCPSCQRL